MILFRRGVLLAAISCIILSAGACFSSEKVLRVKDGKVISFRKMISEIRGASIVIVGENHEDKQHHMEQLAVIRALHRETRPLAVGMEMFPAEAQSQLNSWVAGTGDTREFIKFYYRNWKMPWPLYRDILLYLRNNRIPLLGLNVPAEVTRRVASDGFASLPANDKRRLPPDITCSVDASYMAFIRSAFRAHGHTGTSFLHFCETQKLWNKSMAWHLVRYLEKNPQATVVVVAGAGHALKRAIPAEVKDMSALRTVVILPRMEDMPLEAVTSNAADYVILHR